MKCEIVFRDVKMSLKKNVADQCARVSWSGIIRSVPQNMVDMELANEHGNKDASVLPSSLLTLEDDFLCRGR